MYRPRLIPVLLLKNNGLVKSKNFKDFKYIGDPINAVKIFNDSQADELFFLDITATKENRVIPLELVRSIGEEAHMQIHDIIEYRLSYLKKCMNSKAFHDPL